MKKLTYLVIATAALGMVACTGNKAGYVVTGTVEGAANGDTVYLQEATGRNLTKLDTAVISKGTFTFKGTQDSAVNRYVTCEVNGTPLMVDFFLENGKINVTLGKDDDSVTGTANNDAYQELRAKINDISKKMNAIYEAMGDSTLSDEQKEAKQKEGADLQEQYENAVKEAVQKNITNPVGVFLFKQTFYNNSTAENEALLQQIPANLQNDEAIARIKELTDKQKKTAVGTLFVDFEMQTPEGKTVFIYAVIHSLRQKSPPSLRAFRIHRQHVAALLVHPHKIIARHVHEGVMACKHYALRTHGSPFRPDLSVLHR
jgi:hypothetical protein